MIGVRLKIMWEEQLVDPPIHYLVNKSTKTEVKIEVRPLSSKSESTLRCTHKALSVSYKGTQKKKGTTLSVPYPLILESRN